MLRRHRVPHVTQAKPWIFYANRWPSSVRRHRIIGIPNFVNIAVDSLYPNTWEVTCASIPDVS